MHCDHIEEADPNLAANSHWCEECAITGQEWVELRVCKTCGHVGCCDTSPGRHARSHYYITGHPIMGPADPAKEDGDWLWCYPDDSRVERDGTMTSPSDRRDRGASRSPSVAAPTTSRL